MKIEDLKDIKPGDILTNKMPVNNYDHVIPASGNDYEVIDINKKEITLKALTSDVSAYIYKLPLKEIEKCVNMRKR